LKLRTKSFRFRLALILLANIAAIANGQAGQRAGHAGGQARSREWRAYNGGVDGDHYSPLDQINRGNVRRLRPAWTFDTGEKGGMQTNPLIAGRVLYGYTPTQKIFALDAATGKRLWLFDSGTIGGQPNRGFAYWTDGKERRLLAGVMNFVYALDPNTGKPQAGFGEGGRIDLRKQLGGDEQGGDQDYERRMVVLTSPGVVFKDMLIVGFRTAEEAPAPPGDIRAFDVHTGALRWAFHTIPHPGEFGYESWPKDAWKTAGSANNWCGMSLDEKRGVLYVPTGSPVSDFYGADRVGNGLFGDTLLALDANTGKRIWHFQGVHHDIWDRDFPAPPALVTLRRNGRDLEAIAQTTKQGYLYVFDRVTGKPLFPIEERPYPASTVTGEQTAPTQPFPTAPAPYARQLLTADMITQRTPGAHAQAMQQFLEFRSGGQFVPLAVGRQTVVFPGFDGGAEWGGPAVDVKTGVIYINSNDIPWTGGLVENKKTGDRGAEIYADSCASCHGDERKGSPPAFPSLVGISGRLSDAQIIMAVRNGKGRMPSFPNITDARMFQLIAFLKTGESVMDETATTAPPEAHEDARGARIYTDSCAICHGEDRAGIGDAFPAMLGIGSRRDRQQVLDIIDNGKGRMPGFKNRLSGDDLTHLLNYLGVGTSDEKNPASRPRYRFTGYRKFLDVDNYPAVVPPWGTLNAIDLHTGKYLWKIPLGEYPELAAQGMKATGSENYGGPVVTAGGLLFIGATMFDDKIRAFDSSTGKLLWEYKLPFAGVATPAVYMVDGKEYVVIAASGGRNPKEPAGGLYVAFALP
jgi:glucose dehydrogenase